jgi:hypothetical protein
MAELMAAAPQLVVFNHLGNTVGGMKNEQLEAAYSKLDPPYKATTSYAYDIIRKWALDR